jgi:hypothetical protein
MMMMLSSGMEFVLAVAMIVLGVLALACILQLLGADKEDEE